MIRSIIKCKLQEPPFKMPEPAMNIVVSQSIDNILALAPKPEKERETCETPRRKEIQKAEKDNRGTVRGKADFA